MTASEYFSALEKYEEEQKRKREEIACRQLWTEIDTRKELIKLQAERRKREAEQEEKERIDREKLSEIRPINFLEKLRTLFFKLLDLLG